MRHGIGAIRRCWLAIGGALLSTLATAATGAPQIDDGEWEFTMQMEMKGMPAIAPVRYKNCLTGRDPIPSQEGAMGKECEVVDQEVTDDSVSYTVMCTQGGMTMESRTRSTFRGSSMEGTMQQTMKQGGKVMHTATGKLTGKRIGSCP